MRKGRCRTRELDGDATTHGSKLQTCSKHSMAMSRVVSIAGGIARSVGTRHHSALEDCGMFAGRRWHA